MIALARRQHGLVTRNQATHLGLSVRSIRSRVERGSWQRIRPGVYVVGAVASSWEQSVAAACLAAGEGAYASHRTAARLWGLVPRSGRIELLTHNSRRLVLPGVTGHRSLLLDRRDHTIVREIPVTTIERTIVDLAGAGDQVLMGRWIDLGLREGMLSIDRLIEHCGRLGGPGRGIPLAVLAAIALRRPGYDPGRSALESRALAALALAGLPAPERQYPVTRPDGRKAFIDMAYPEAPLAIEADGFETHGTRQAFEEDRIRGNELRPPRLAGAALHLDHERPLPVQHRRTGAGRSGVTDATTTEVGERVTPIDRDPPTSATILQVGGSVTADDQHAPSWKMLGGDGRAGTGRGRRGDRRGGAAGAGPPGWGGGQSV
ncbi:type IV toxin-antitoxin system AbiEi family antitoxin domain-containing protein [Aquihabitans daechungensis]|uniref:type IV toxin-antitoxin system AbiEi family antitoxin domain-containing protein n=1 Tax=Aquihabitans daechungensis TaxID=1052257 RepID=UPI003BA2234F